MVSHTTEDFEIALNDQADNQQTWNGTELLAQTFDKVERFLE